MLGIVVILFIALMIPGIINRTRAILSGRKGVSLYQHVSNVSVLLSKGAVYSPVTTFIFRIAPVIYLASALTAMMMVPFGNSGAVISFNGDVVMFCYLLALGRVMLILGALDTGSSFEGMGASREALYGALAEPALMLITGTLAMITGYTSFEQIFLNMGKGGTEMIVVMVLFLYVVIKIILVEAGRVPVDDPRTHLELTMIHEVMVLDYCGFDLGLITIGGWVKTAVLAVIGASALASSFYYNGLVIILICLVIAVSIGIVESWMARNKLSRNATYILTITAMSFLIFMVCFLILLEINI